MAIIQLISITESDSVGKIIIGKEKRRQFLRIVWSWLEVMAYNIHVKYLALNINWNISPLIISS